MSAPVKPTFPILIGEIATEVPQVVDSTCPDCGCFWTSRAEHTDNISTHRQMFYRGDSVHSEILFGYAYQERGIVPCPNWIYCTNCKKVCSWPQ
jgi:hypothetical protein